jgi:hypothetical protein
MENNPNPEGIAVTQDEIIEMAIQGHASTRDAIRWAMNQEREACAKIADEWAVGWPHPSQSIAEWIRKRT